MHSGALGVDDGFASKLVDGGFASSVALPSRLVHADVLGDQGDFVRRLVRKDGSTLVRAGVLGTDEGFASTPARIEGLGSGGYFALSVEPPPGP